MSIYYDGKKILSMKDLDKDEPSFYLISTNRSAGKTTYFLKLALETFIKTGKKLGLIYRYSYELKSCSEIFNDIMRIYPELEGEMKAIPHAKGLFYEVFFNEKSFCYAFSLNNPDAIKKYSPLFADVDMCIFDEFQTESGKYLSKETEKLQSLLLTIARGGGSQSRHIKIFMLSNNVSIMNPYYITFGIHKRLKSDTKFMRGKGWVAEFGFNEGSSNAIKKNGIYKAFADSDYMRYSAQKEYLHITDTFIEKPTGKSKYLFTFIYEKKAYGVREYFEQGILHISKKADMNYQYVVAFKPSDHNQNTIMLNNYCYLWDNIKTAFTRGYLRFDDVETKNVVFDILAIDIYK